MLLSFNIRKKKKDQIRNFSRNLFFLFIFPSLYPILFLYFSRLSSCSSSGILPSTSSFLVFPLSAAIKNAQALLPYHDLTSIYLNRAFQLLQFLQKLPLHAFLVATPRKIARRLLPKKKNQKKKWSLKKVIVFHFVFPRQLWSSPLPPSLQVQFPLHC